jgi:hypothetical protein
LTDLPFRQYRRVGGRRHPALLVPTIGRNPLPSLPVHRNLSSAGDGRTGHPHGETDHEDARESSG